MSGLRQELPLLTISRWLVDGTEFFAFGSETFVRITGLVRGEASVPRYARLRRRTQHIGWTVNVAVSLLTDPTARTNARCRKTPIFFRFP